MANKMSDADMWIYLEKQDPYWLRQIIAVAKDILAEKEEELDDCSTCEGCYNCTGEVKQE